MTTPLISICLPNLNTRPFLEERMATLLGQTVSDWELIICDSHSTDGSWEFFQTFQKDPRVRLEKVPQAGIYAGWNECLHRARGEYVYIATSDDTAEPDLLEKLLQSLIIHRDVDMATCNYKVIDDEGKPFVDEDSPYGKEIYGDWYNQAHRRHGLSEFVATCAGFTTWNTINTVLMRRTLLDKTGLFREGRSSLYDYEWGLKACLCTDTIHVPETLAAWRVHRQQATAKVKIAKTVWTYMDMIDDVYQTMGKRIPETLKTKTARERLQWPRRVIAFNTLGLYISHALRFPTRFAQHLSLGLRHEPGMTARHLARGGRWKSRPQVSLRSYVEQLLQDFQLPPICTPLPTTD